MIRQLFSMIWRQKKSNFLLVFQLFISFLAMTLFIAMNVEKFSDYFRPYTYNYGKMWGVSMTLDSIPREQAKAYLRLTKLKLRTIRDIEVVSNSSNIPFWTFGDQDELTFNGQKIRARGFTVDEDYQKAMNLPLLKGRWLERQDGNSATTPVVITNELAAYYFKDQDPIGQVIETKKRKLRVIGVTEYRDNNSVQVGSDTKGCFFRLSSNDDLMGDFLLRSDRADDFLGLDEKIRKELSSIKDPRFTIRTSAPVSLIKKLETKTDLIQLTIALLVFAFLVLNIFLGISGVFSYSISKRRAEIGLRVASGAGSGSIIKQFLSETIVLTSFAVIPGIIIALQFFITGFFGWISVWNGFAGIAGALLFIYMLMISCCIYPSLKASKIQPAEALHED